MLYFIMMLLLGGVWAFCIAMQIDRSDLISFIPLTNQFGIDVAFFALQFIAVLYVSWLEIKNNNFNATQIIQLLLRNLTITGCGVVLLVFTSREVLNGLDPTGKAPILGLSPQRAQAATPPRASLSTMRPLLNQQRQTPNASGH